ncbi:T9SS type A sorting domain-containing protein [Epilithonimonas xixisoli]|uniref:Putative secreted protein (Por secretion system target) n=1 Tax=Epilithonimonas xixisoli TaxID=1476462 RepID=A0A4R8I4C0_9FLAO|nr:T9SS type A sorting domain-containing protein [Epilithonimonas xixisoli]TDX83113.1 putative secreted protein (Por secretion system target) [Epilithonimonas xixisoli]
MKTKITVLLLLLTVAMKAQKLVHYWNFNNNSTLESISNPNVSLVGGASLISAGSGVVNFNGGTGQNFNVQNLNARNGDVSGTHLRYNSPTSGSLVFSLPTTLFENIVVKFATRVADMSSGVQRWSYTTDGSTYNVFQSVTVQNINPQLITLNFKNVANVKNNPNFKLKVEFLSGNSGSHRFDNFSLDGNPIPTTISYYPTSCITNVPMNTDIEVGFSNAYVLIDGTPLNNINIISILDFGNYLVEDFVFPTAVVSPADGSTVSTAFTATVQFSEAIRYANCTEIGNTTSVHPLFELKQGMLPMGLSFDTIYDPFTYTFTIISTDEIYPNSDYLYLIVKPNVVKDLANNSFATQMMYNFKTGSNKSTGEGKNVAVSEDDTENKTIKSNNSPSNKTEKKTLGFTATIDNNIIKIKPNSILEPNKQYYVRIKPNVLKDLNNNILTQTSYSTFTTGTTLSTNESLTKLNKISIYPNPVKDILHIQNNGESVKTITIYDASGRQMLTKKAAKEINVSKLQKGAYVVTLETDKEVKSFKIIKE